MTDFEVIVSADLMKAKVDIDNIVIGKEIVEGEIVLDNIASHDDVTADDTTTDDQGALIYVDDANNMKKELVCSDFDEKNKNLINNNSGNGKKKRHRRGRSKKRKWKPYNKLTWDEKRQQEDRESLRAHRIRAERFAHGKPVAPYNTTQFLMDDHNVQEPDLEDVPNGRSRAGEQQRQRRESAMDSDNYYSSPEDEEEFLQKEFSQVYQNIYAERLNTMSKIELIHEYMTLEDKVEMLEQRIKDEKGSAEEKTQDLQQRIQSLEEVVNRLKSENDRLKISDVSEVSELSKNVELARRQNEMTTATDSRSSSATEEDDEDEKEKQLSKALTKFSVVECCSEQAMDIETPQKEQEEELSVSSRIETASMNQMSNIESDVISSSNENRSVEEEKV